jgi:heparan-alpha-glucosaminide N-acetyltransferase
MSAHVVGKEGGRLLSLDAYRGFIMLAMASGGLGLAQVAQHDPASQLWQFLDRQTEHAAWRGCSFWDLIQPSFMFIVGVAMPYSYASRRAAGQSKGRLFLHALARSLVLIGLAIFLSSAWSKRTHFTFTNVLAQIGLGYTFVFLLLGRSARVQFAAACGVLVGYWLFFALHPLPSGEESFQRVWLMAKSNGMRGFQLHWARDVNAAAAFDAWFLNLFPQPNGRPFTYNEGGYATLNFVPSIATMLFGVLAGEFLRSNRTGAEKVQGLILAAALGLVLGTVLDQTVCPLVKRIWTPSWAIYSAGWTCCTLAAFHAVIDVAGYRRWAFPLVVVGANSIAIYVMSQLLKPFVKRTLQVHLGPHLFDGIYGPIVASTSVLFVFWLICLWMYRQRIFVKI